MVGVGMMVCGRVGVDMRVCGRMQQHTGPCVRVAHSALSVTQAYQAYNVAHCMPGHD